MSEPHAAALESGNRNSERGFANNDLVAMALAVAERWPVFPCGADKRPLPGSHGFKDATRDPDTIRKAFQHPDAKLIGVPTGAETFDAFDLDPRHGSHRWREANIHRMPETRIHQTPGLPEVAGDPVMPGEHWLFSHSDGVRNQAGKIAPGLDIRGEGGYIIVPPSAGYTIMSDVEIAPWPAWLLPLALKPPQKPPPRPAFTPARATDLLDRRYQGFVLKLLDNVRRAPEGAKHDVLLRQARALGGVTQAAGITESDAVGHLLAALPNTVRNWKSAAKTALDGLRHGAATPIDLEAEDRPGPAARKTRGNGLHHPQPDTGRPAPEPEIIVGNGAAPPPQPADGEPPPPESEDPSPEAEQPEAPLPTDPQDAVLEEFNTKFMVVNENGKAVIYQPGYDQVLKRRCFNRMSKGDLQTLYMNRKVRTGTTATGRAIYKLVATFWLGHPDRRQFVGGVVFDPGMRCPPDVLNLWEGFAIEPAPGDWSLLREHIEIVVCGADPVQFSYLLRWMARMVQNPAEQGEVAVVMKGPKGSGKGTLAKVLLRITGHHGIAISQAKHLTGNFNNHLRDAVLLFPDEAFFAGDRQHIGALNSLITEPYLTIEGKFANAYQAPNFLHVIMASNEDWVVPASLDERRYFVLNVSDARAGDHAYFAAIWKQMEAGGYAAMLHDLLATDLTDFNVRSVPNTDGLQDQRKLSLPVPERWWMDVLHRGYVFRSKLGLEAVFGEWLPDVSTELLFASYEEFARQAHERRPMSREWLGRFMLKMECKPKRLFNAPVGEHITDATGPFGHTSRTAEVVKGYKPMGYVLGELQLARADFCKITGLTHAWQDEDDGS